MDTDDINITIDDLDDQWEMIEALFNAGIYDSFLKAFQLILDQNIEQHSTKFLSFITKHNIDNIFDQMNSTINLPQLTEENIKLFISLLSNKNIQLFILPKLFKQGLSLEFLERQRFEITPLTFKALFNECSYDPSNLFSLILKVHSSTIPSDIVGKIEEIITHSNDSSTIRLGCSLIRKCSIEKLVSLLNLPNKLVVNAIADELFISCYNKDVVKYLRELLSRNKLVLPCSRMKDVVISVLQSNQPSLPTLERVQMALSLTQNEVMKDLGDYIMQITHLDGTKPTELIECCFKVLYKSGRTKHDELVNTIRYICERIVPPSQQLNPRKIHLKHNEELCTVFVRETVGEFLKRNGKNSCSLIAFGDVISNDIAFEDTGLCDGDSIEIRTDITSVQCKERELVNVQSLETIIPNILAGRLERKLEILEVLPYVQLIVESNYTPYFLYSLYFSQKSIEDLVEIMLCFEVDSEPESYSALCLLLQKFDAITTKELILHCIENITTPLNKIKFIYQLITTFELHPVLADSLQNIIIDILPQLFEYVPNNSKYSFNLFYCYILQYYPQYYPQNINQTIQYLNHVSTIRSKWYILLSLQHLKQQLDIQQILQQIPITNQQNNICNGLQNPNKYLCYMNSFLIQMFMIDQFTEIILSSSSTSKIISLLQQLFQYLIGEKSFFDMNEFVNEFQKFTNLPLKEFNDVDEFMLIFWDVMEQVLPIAEYQALDKCFTFTTTFTNDEKHRSLIIPFGISSVEQYIALNKDHLSTIKEYPQYLQIQLQRSVIINGQSTKNVDEIGFGYSLDVPFQGNTIHYQLKGIIVHQGTVGVGHYISYIVNTKTREWTCFDDGVVSKIPWYAFDIQQKAFGGNDDSWTAYIIIYEQVNSCINNSHQLINTITSLHSNLFESTTIILPNTIVKELYNFNSLKTIPRSSLYSLLLAKNCLVNLTDESIVHLLFKFISHESDLVKSITSNFFEQSLRQLHSTSTPIINKVLSSILPIYQQQQQTKEQFKQTLRFIKLIIQNSKPQSLPKEVYEYCICANNSLLSSQSYYPNVYDSQIRQLLQDIIDLSNITLNDVLQNLSLFQLLIETSNGIEIVKSLFKENLFELAQCIKYSIKTTKLSYLFNLIELILNSNDIKSIYSLLSIYQSNSQHLLPPQYCNGLFTMIQPNDDGLLLIKLIVQSTNPIVDQCLQEMYGSYRLIKKTLMLYCSEKKGISIETYQTLRNNVDDLGIREIYEKNTFISVLKKKICLFIFF
ncbi:USP domain-containing protein [Entamoeba marina]